MNVYKYNKLFYSNVDYAFCENYLYENIPDLKDIIPEVKKNVLDILNFEKMNKAQFDKLLLACVRKVSNTCSTASRSYWLARGYTDSEIDEIISVNQRKRSNLCVEYWEKQGYSKDEAEIKVSDIQKINSKKSNSKRNIKYWEEQGYSKDDAETKLKEVLDKSSCRTVGFWIRKGMTEEEAKKEIKRRSGLGGSKDYYIEKYGEEGLQILEKINKSKARFGSENGMYGKPSPIGSGRGISGYYKGNYFRSLYEFFVMYDYERNGISFVCNDVLAANHPKEKVIVEYIIDGKCRSYTPDFIVGSSIVEVKNKHGFGTKEWLAKEKSILEYIETHPLYTELKKITEDDFCYDVSLAKTEFVSGNLTIDVGKLERFKNIVGL